MNYTVEVSALTKKFGDFTAVDNVNFSVREGEIFGFLGPNGAGKSTTIKMLCGILVPTSGSGRVAGADIMTGQEQIKNSIGYMSQRFSLYEELTVAENLTFYGTVYGLEGSMLASRIRHVMDLAGIDKKNNLPVKKLPGGIKQRLALGAAILHDPPILFLDEPTSGVDPIMRRAFWDLIYDFSRAGKTIFVTTHYMDEAEHCGRIALIAAGKLIAMDTPRALKDGLPLEVYSLKVKNFVEVFEKISGLEYISEAAIFGSDIHIMCEKKFPLIRELTRDLKRAGVDSFSIDGIHPSLEEVFVVSAGGG
jgi:ABC-2 type transport system ATP-binding protein